MCTRFNIDRADCNPFLEEIIKRASSTPLAQRFMEKFSKPLITEGEVRPTDVAAVVAPDKHGKKAVFPMKWGFTIPGNRSPIINARCETAAVKPTFAESWKRHRCAIPASWYYEWEHIRKSDGKTVTGEKYTLQPAGCNITWLCGLYRIENNYPVFSVLTREPSEALLHIHDRMPFILPKELIDEWISPDSIPEEYMQCALTDIIAEKA